MHSLFGKVQYFRAKKAESVFQASAWKKRTVATLKMQGAAHCLTGFERCQPEL